MCTNTALNGLDAVVTALSVIDPTKLSVADRLQALERLETARRRQVAVFHAIVDSLDEDLPLLHKAVADVTRISLAEARRRVRNAEQLAPRTTLTGQPLPPALPETAEAWQAGILGEEHLAVIQKFVRDLPGHIASHVVARSEEFLAEQAAHLRPDQLEKLAAQLTTRINPDGTFNDDDRARQRGFTWCGGQRADGTSVGKLVATPQLRAELDAWFAKFAAPGMCNPTDPTPTLDSERSGDAAQQAAQRDVRSHSQRQHDALGALVRGQLGDPKLGTHNGLPVTVIATASIQDLQTDSGHAVTAAGTRLPISELIRIAGHAHHYLTLFDGATGRPLWLGRAKRVASADQRIVLHASDRGCSHPDCDVPGYLCEVHHVDEWANGGPTDIDNLTFACPAHHKLIDQGWKTRKLANGQTQWIPPPQLPLPGGTNDFHHPERLLADWDDAA
ncbi:MAG: HNH endonuclease [Actinomycetia bacterium]|nr:HNH endonuclease [Actinomycetes bacterium]MCH9702314.1 HNH endonuclease [Actinomycetes bacterium]MCH9762318.1 HNH endonuclease [Actinomycetes bacterium]